MSKISEALKEKRRAQLALGEAKCELLSAVAELIEESPDGLFARDVADLAGVHTREIIGTLASAEHRRIIQSRPHEREAVYVLLRPDGSINPNDRIVRRYTCNKYSIADDTRR